MENPPSLAPDATVIYKSVGELKLKMLLYVPKDAKDKEPRPSVLLIHGGAWKKGNPESYAGMARRFNDMGLRVFSLQYRLCGKNTQCVSDCVKDARSAVRYLKSHAAELGVQPGKLIVCGASAGGHLSISTALFETVNEDGDDLSISCAPDALVLLNPVTDTSKDGYGNDRLGEDWKALSPLHNVKPGMPSTIVLHATDDKIVPYKNAVDFQKSMDAAGNDCELQTYPKGDHTFYFKKQEVFNDVMGKIGAFLLKRGFVKTPPSPEGKSNVAK